MSLVVLSAVAQYRAFIRLSYILFKNSSGLEASFPDIWQTNGKYEAYFYFVSHHLYACLLAKQITRRKYNVKIYEMYLKVEEHCVGRGREFTRHARRLIR